LSKLRGFVKLQLTNRAWRWQGIL